MGSRLVFDPSVRVTLESGGKRIELAAADLASLREFHPEGPPTDGSALLRRLFGDGFLVPENPLSTAAQWASAIEGLDLAPDLELKLAFVRGGRRLRSLEPSIGLFLDPAFVELVEDLSGVLRYTLDQVAHSCAVTGFIDFEEHYKSLVATRRAAEVGSSRDRRAPLPPLLASGARICYDPWARRMSIGS